MFLLKTVSQKALPLHSMKKHNSPIQIPEGIISLYAKITGPKTNRTIKLALDTGASFTMIPIEIARDIGYDSALAKRRIEISTANGLIFVPVITVVKISFMGLTLKNIDVICHDLPSESPVEGLLGLNFLIHLPAFIEFFQKIQPYT